MKIVFVNNFWQGIGGGERQLLLVIEGLQSRGVEVQLIAPVGSEIAEATCTLGAEVTECSLAKSDNLATRKIISEVGTGADFVVGTGHWTNLLVSGATLGTDTKKIALHQSMPDAAQGGLEKFIRRLTMTFGLRNIDGHIAVSKAVKDALVAQGFSAEKIEVIYNGAPLPPRANIVTADSHSPKESPVLGYMGRLEIVKGCDLLLKTLKTVQETTPDITLRVAGFGSQEDTLRHLANDLDLGEAIDFCGYQDSYNFLGSVDMLIMPSRAEAFGLSAVEAQRAGIPVIAFDVGGISEALVSNTTTKLVPAGDTELLAEAILEMLVRLPQLNNDLQNNAQVVLQNFTPDQTAAAYYQYFSSKR